MAGKRQPTSVVIANGRKHLTKAETDARLDAEVRMKQPKTAKPPKWLPENMKKEFRAIGKKLIACGLYSELDADTLGQYLVSRYDWINAEKMSSEYVAAGKKADAKEWVSIQNTLFKQCRQCAESLGLTISSRCKLMIPQGLQNPNAGEPEDEFTQRLREHQAEAFAASE